MVYKKKSCLNIKKWLLGVGEKEVEFITKRYNEFKESFSLFRTYGIKKS
jgi:L-2-hydroxyglutarate oxidase LhgO